MPYRQLSQTSSKVSSGFRPTPHTVVSAGEACTLGQLDLDLLGTVSLPNCQWGDSLPFSWQDTACLS